MIIFDIWTFNINKKKTLWREYTFDLNYSITPNDYIIVVCAYKHVQAHSHINEKKILSNILLKHLNGFIYFRIYFLYLCYFYFSFYFCLTCILCNIFVFIFLPFLHFIQFAFVYFALNFLYSISLPFIFFFMYTWMCTSISLRWYKSQFNTYNTENVRIIITLRRLFDNFYAPFFSFYYTIISLYHLK